MSKLADLIAQRDALDKAIRTARQEESKDAITTVRKLVAQYNLGVSDVFPNLKRSPLGKTTSDGRSNVTPKYKDPASGQTWTGRGKAPKWIAGKNRDAFLIK